jgi:site-specific DNA-methyltransferase (adenine-specific)
MGKKWDTTGNFYDWCFKRAVALHRVIKSGGYVLIFGHPKTNHRMKCAFEDAGFNIVEEIDWVYGTGFPKNQDIGKLFDKKAGAEREVIGTQRQRSVIGSNNGWKSDISYAGQIELNITSPSTDKAKQWNGWKTAGLKPAHEPITVFQKPLEGTYINNIEKYNCGGMNIDACRIPTSQEDKDMINAKASKNPTTNYSDSEERIYGAYAEDKSMPANEIGRFPANMIFDSSMGEVLDSQSGILKSGAIKAGQPAGTDWNSGDISHERDGGRKVQPKDIPASEGGASRYFLKIDSDDFVPFLYCAKPTKKEKGEGNIHVTVKPKELIKWLIKLVTPVGGRTIDITAGSGTHGVACEELNRDENYNLHWLNIEMLNTEKEPYCEIAKNRIQHVVDKVS